jgi:uncharacterized protein YmfQ (DUF2313 family)
MAFSISQYRQQLAALLPRGILWDSLREPGKLFSVLLEALAVEFYRVDSRCDDLIDESDPRSMSELLPEYEAFYGLPDVCLGDTEQSLSQRREQLYARMTSAGGQSRPVMISLAESMGYAPATITEFERHTVDASVDAPLYGEEWVWSWQLNVPDQPVTRLTVDDNVDTSLGEVSPNVRLECAVDRVLHSHMTVIFNYQ